MSGDMLATTRFAARTPSDQPPLMIVHGLFGSARNWVGIARVLSAHRDVLTVDQRNHGESPWFPTHSYADMAEDLAAIIDREGRMMDALGHSMGGKACMVLALIHPGLVDRLIVADIAPVAYTHDNTAHIARMRALDLTPPLSRAELDRRMAALEPDPALRAFFLQSLDVRAEPPRWRLNFDVLAAFMPQITGWPEIAGRFDGRTLFLSGANSAYVLPDHRDQIHARFPHARFVRIPGAGHWLHADQPRAFAETVEVFLSGGQRGDEPGADAITP
jgi:pimeloyl-ACP methyl ester carboxylesterase